MTAASRLGGHARRLVSCYPWGAGRFFALLVCSTLHCANYALMPTDPGSSGVIEQLQNRVSLGAMPNVARLNAVRRGLTALWIEVSNEGTEPVRLNGQEVEPRIAGHSLWVTVPENVPLTTERPRNMALPYSRDPADGWATVGVVAPTSRPSDRSVFTESRTSVLRSAFKGGSLEPGESHKGFLYFALPSEDFSPVELRVPVQPEGKAASYEMRVLFQYVRQ